MEAMGHGLTLFRCPRTGDFWPHQVMVTRFLSLTCVRLRLYVRLIRMQSVRLVMPHPRLTGCGSTPTAAGCSLATPAG
jgi:hypothetical protein